MKGLNRFENLIYYSASNNNSSRTVNCFPVLLIGLLICFFLIEEGGENGAVYGVSVLGISFLVFFYLLFRIKSATKWIETLRKNPEAFVWAYRVKTVPKRLSVLSFEKLEMKLYLSTSEYVKIEFDDFETQQVFFRGLKHFLPHVQYGYNTKLSSLFSFHHDEDFIGELKKNGWYTPIEQFDISEL